MKIFFTHCGMHGVMEAIYYGVPMVGMPVFIDQVDVLARIEQKGIGVGLDKWASSKEIRFAIDSVLNDVRWVKLTIYHQVVFLDYIDMFRYINNVYSIYVNLTDSTTMSKSFQP